MSVDCGCYPVSRRLLDLRQAQDISPQREGSVSFEIDSEFTQIIACSETLKIHRDRKIARSDIESESHCEWSVGT